MSHYNPFSCHRRTIPKISPTHHSILRFRLRQDQGGTQWREIMTKALSITYVISVDSDLFRLINKSHIGSPHFYNFVPSSSHPKLIESVQLESFVDERVLWKILRGKDCCERWEKRANSAAIIIAGDQEGKKVTEEVAFLSLFCTRGNRCFIHVGHTGCTIIIISPWHLHRQKSKQLMLSVEIRCHPRPHSFKWLS